MGEITDMVLEGTLCQECGIYIEPDEEGEAGGYPRTCADCQDDSDESRQDCAKAKAKCPVCGKHKRNVDAHIKAVHEEARP